VILSGIGQGSISLFGQYKNIRKKLKYHFKGTDSLLEKNYKTTLPAHDGKRQLMVPGGRFMAENDRSWQRQASPDCLVSWICWIG